MAFADSQSLGTALCLGSGGRLDTRSAAESNRVLRWSSGSLDSGGRCDVDDRKAAQHLGDVAPALPVVHPNTTWIPHTSFAVAHNRGTGREAELSKLGPLPRLRTSICGSPSRHWSDRAAVEPER